MSKKLRIGIVGCGAIGCSLAKAVKKDFCAEAELAALYDLDGSKSERLSRLISKNRNLAVASLVKLINKSDLVIEAASAKCSRQVATDALSKGRDCMVMSVGGIVDSYRQLSSLAKKHNARVYIPSGAISGIDALKAAKIAKIKSVTISTRKNPISFKGVRYVEEKGINLEKIKNDKILFSGPAEKAVKYFPQNINVAAILSLAGIGPKKTMVQIIASPSTTKNIHEIKIDSVAAGILTCTENVLHPDNPKTSYLAILSAIATLKQILEPVKIGT